MVISKNHHWWLVTSQFLETVNVTLLRKSVFANVIKDIEMRSLSWIILVGLKSSVKCPYKRILIQVVPGNGKEVERGERWEGEITKG